MFFLNLHENMLWVLIEALLMSTHICFHGDLRKITAFWLEKKKKVPYIEIRVCMPNTALIGNYLDNFVYRGPIQLSQFT